MDLVFDSFRWGREHLSDGDFAWKELVSVLNSITRDEIVDKKLESFVNWRSGKRKSPAVGGQSVLNEIIDSKLNYLNWESQIFVLDLPKLSGEDDLVLKRDNYWTMDFKKNFLGVEISFNNAGALAQNLLRLSVMSESRTKPKEQMIRLGILVTATTALKKWSNMDSTCVTFETVQRVFPAMNFNIPTPIVLIGLNNSSEGEIWPESELFGHQKLEPFEKLSDSEKSEWEEKLRLAGFKN